MSLGITQLTGFGGGGGGPATVSQTAKAVSTTDLTEYTFSGQSIGAAQSDRKVVVVTSGVEPDSAASVSTLTVGGIAATLVLAVQNTTENLYATEIWQADVPTGTTGDVVVTWATAMQNCAIGVFRVTAAASAAHATASDNSADPTTANIDVPGGGILIGGAANNASATYTWTNLTEKYDEAFESAETHTGASDAFTAAQTARTITCDQTAGNRPRLALASWGPS